MPSIKLLSSLQAFSEVARLGSISAASSTLGIGRATIRDHLARLADELNNSYPLVDTSQEHGVLTEAGTDLYLEIKSVFETLEQAIDSVKNRGALGGDSEMHKFYCEPKNPATIDKGGAVPLIQRAWRAWRSNGISPESDSLAPLRPWLIVYRKIGNEWLLVDVGKKSSFATWFGPANARRARSQKSRYDLTSDSCKRHTMHAYDTALAHYAPRYDHVYTHFSREVDGAVDWVSYQRLIMPLRWSEKTTQYDAFDNDNVVGVMIARTNQILIKALDDKHRHLLPDELLMEFDPYNEDSML